MTTQNNSSQSQPWLATTSYTAGMTVTEGGVTYIADWWTEGDDPSIDNGAIGSGEPWTIVSTTTPPAGTPPAAVPAWNAATAYTTGMEVLENGVTYSANWWTQGNDPARNNGAIGTGQPWTIVLAGGAASGANSVPDAPTQLTATSTTSSSVTLAWTEAAVPGGGAVTGYTVLEDGVVVGTTSSTSYTVTALAAATQYALTVEARDQYGLSQPSAALTVTTAAATPNAPGAVAAWSAGTVYTAGMQASEAGLIYQANWWNEGDNPVNESGPAGSGEVWTVIGKLNNAPTAPDAPTNLDAAATSSTSASLFWTAASVEGSGTVTGYAVFANGQQIGTTTATNYDATGLIPSDSYAFTVEAIDATGASPPSAAATVTLPAAGTQIEPTAVFAPYIDMSLYGNPSLVSVAEASGTKNFTLAFVQSSGPDTVGWAGTGTIDNDSLPDGTTILSQVQALRAIGGDVTISFGGASGTDPAADASSAAALQAEYQSVIDRYGVTSLDFDIEGAQVADQAAINLRDQALINLETVNPGLKISFTLPVLPSGLDSNGVNVLDSAAHAGVRIDVVNIMAMDYGGSQDNGGAMGTDAIDAIKATEAQIAAAGLTSKVGVTPMIGVNDISSEVFTLANAQQLASYVQTDPDVARVAMWSVARDNGAGAGQNYASPNTSGIAQTPYEFSSILQHA